MKREVKIMDNLINLVLKQIQDDVDSGDLTALEELLKRVPAKVLESYLPEVDMDEVETEYDGQPDEAQEWHDFDPEC
jgi:hypothetical protein